MDNKSYMEKILEEMQNKVKLSIYSNDYARGYCYGLLDYIIENNEIYDDFAYRIDSVFGC